MVTPGGTGTPALVISASPAPLPPSTSRMPALPSARPSPKKYTHCAEVSKSLLRSASMGRVSVTILLLAPCGASASSFGARGGFLEELGRDVARSEERRAGQE